MEDEFLHTVQQKGLTRCCNVVRLYTLSLKVRRKTIPKAMERKITSSVPAPARRYRRAITPKPSRRITARCGVLMVAGIFTFVMVFEFILIHRHKPHNSITNSKGPLRESSKGDADSPSRGDTFLPKPTGERRESTFAASPPHAVFNSSGPNIGHVDLLPPRLTTKPEDYPDDGTIVDNGSQQGEDCYGGMRVAVLVPYSGPGLPLWFDSFVELAAASKDAVDWIIFCEEVRYTTNLPCSGFDTPTWP